MPSYVHNIEVDWSYRELEADEQRIVRGHEAQLRAEPGVHTADTLEEALVLASRELPGRLVVVGYANEDGDEFGFVLQDGALVDEDRDVDEAGTYTGALDAADYAAGGVTRVYKALFWPQPVLDALIAEAARRDVSLSWVTGRILALDAEPSSGPRHEFGPRLTDARMQMQSVYLPPDRLLELEARASEADCSVSTLVREAFERCWSRLVAE